MNAVVLTENGSAVVEVTDSTLTTITAHRDKTEVGNNLFLNPIPTRTYTQKQFRYLPMDFTPDDVLDAVESMLKPTTSLVFA